VLNEHDVGAPTLLDSRIRDRFTAFRAVSMSARKVGVAHSSEQIRACRNAYTSRVGSDNRRAMDGLVAVAKRQPWA
jgi:hypothetical protein